MKQTIAAKDLSQVQLNILQAFNIAARHTPKHILNATGTQDLMSRILPDASLADTLPYRQAMCQLVGSRWVKCLTLDPKATLKTYQLSEEVQRLKLPEPAAA